MEGMGRLTRCKKFLAQNEQLLSSGEFSDVTITCQGREWKLHQSIICPRSKFFQRAFRSGFKEGVEKSLDLAETDPELFHWVVTYLYTGDCDWITGMEGNGVNPFVFAMQLCLTADYICLDLMILDICAYLRAYYIPTAQEVQNIYKLREYGPIARPFIKGLHESRIDEYLEGAETVFDNEAPCLEPLRETVLMFLPDTSYEILRNPAFIAGLQDHPALLRAIMNHLFAEGSAFRGLLPANWRVPRQCDECTRSGRHWIKERKFRYETCPDCRNMDLLEAKFGSLGKS